ncbi:MAG: RHS repeat-associated core domain-containing protein [Phycisphaerae bacterium]
MSDGEPASPAEYFGGLGRQLINATGGPVYDGHDQVGSAVLTTDAQSGSNNGARMSRRYFTAFGERVAELGEGGQPPPAWAATTFGYCGAWGYEGSAEWPTESGFGGSSGGGSGGSSGGGSGGSPSSDNFWESDLGVLHVGARWYWPETGRFLQRDPIGVGGGLNTYIYASESVLDEIDPSGLAPESMVRGHDWGFRDHIEQGRSAGRPVPSRYGETPPLAGPPWPLPPPPATPPPPHSGFHGKHVGGGLCLLGAGAFVVGSALEIGSAIFPPAAPFAVPVGVWLQASGGESILIGGGVHTAGAAFD